MTDDRSAVRETPIEVLASQAADEMEARAIKWAAAHCQCLPATRLGLASLLVEAFIAGAITGANGVDAAIRRSAGRRTPQGKSPTTSRSSEGTSEASTRITGGAR